jgi:hypothetical protein
MSTIQIIIPDALAERMTNEEIQQKIQSFLQEQVRHISESSPFDDVLVADFSLEDALRNKPYQHIDFAAHPFIGLWADREDMQDSTSFASVLRKEMNRFTETFPTSS